jgi:hypothetical protein
MTPIRKLNDGGEELRTERFRNLRKVKRRDYHDSGGKQRQFQELVDEFNPEEQHRERDSDTDKADIKHRAGKKDAEQLEILQNKASYQVRKTKDDDDDVVGNKIDVEG